MESLAARIKVYTLVPGFSLVRKQSGQYFCALFPSSEMAYYPAGFILLLHYFTFIVVRYWDVIEPIILLLIADAGVEAVSKLASFLRSFGGRLRYAFDSCEN
jgi:hypothetical protein